MIGDFTTTTKTNRLLHIFYSLPIPPLAIDCIQANISGNSSPNLSGTLSVNLSGSISATCFQSISQSINQHTIQAEQSLPVIVIHFSNPKQRRRRKKKRGQIIVTKTLVNDALIMLPLSLHHTLFL
ncbi:hypothetical protein BD560DRAFT_216630 [Blakeslea trispora]|nr:hypothetical protein BD560DRAFT_216630 [Blakeslea trispora]